MSLKVNTESIQNRLATLNVEVPGERLQAALQQAARRLSQRNAIPGFRAGKAPYAVVERTLGRERIFDEALDQLRGQIYPEALETSGLTAIDQAEMEVVSREPLTLRLQVPLEPIVELGDYRSLRVEPREVSVAPQEVDKALEGLRDQQAQWVPVERPAANRDLLTLDIRGRVGPKAVLEVREGQYLLELGSGSPLPGFPEMVEGLGSEESRHFDLTYPADHPDPELAGKRVSFEVVLHAVKEKQLPALDDEFVRSLGDYAGLEALRERVQQTLLRQAEAQERERVAEEVLSRLAKDAHIEYPPILLERELDELIRDHAHLLSHRGFTLQRYLELSGKSLEGLREELRPQAEERLRKSLGLRKLVEMENISVEESEVDQEINVLSSQLNSPGAGDAAARAEALRRVLAQPESQRSIRSRLYGRKALERLVEIGLGGTELTAKGAAAEEPAAVDQRSSL